MRVFQAPNASNVVFSLLHHLLLNSFKESSMLVKHFSKLMSWGNLYLGPLEITRRKLTFEITSKLPVTICPKGLF